MDISFTEKRDDTLTVRENLLYKKMGKAMRLLANNPRHPGLNSHEIDSLSRRYGMKVWESYLENRQAELAGFFGYMAQASRKLPY